MPVQRAVPLGEQVASELQRAIVVGDEPAGSVFTEESLAEQFDVSRGPIRDALRILEQQHLVEKHGRSYTVIGLDNADLDEIYRLRTAVETTAWNYLYENQADTEELDTAIAHMADAAKRHDAEAFAKADIDFHSIAVRLSEKRRVIAMWHQIEPSIRLILQVTNLVEGDFDDVLHKHEHLVTVLREQSAEDLYAAVAEHIDNSRRMLH